VVFLKKEVFTLLFVGMSGCSSLLYQPVREQIYDPAPLGFEYEEIIFPSTDGIQLNAWHFKSKLKKSPKAVIVFFHGNGENLTTHFATLAWILQYEYDYMIFDYRGYGKSEGSPSPEGTVKDGVAAIQYASQRWKNIPIVVLGQSLGGAVAIRSVVELTQKVPIKLVVIDSSFLSYRKVGQKVLSHHWFTWILQPFAGLFLSDTWAPEGRVSKISPIPMIVIHGKKDQIVDYDLGEEVYRLALDPKEFWSIQDGKHTDVFWRHGEFYRKKLIEKLESIL
jgi:uncharacterized protein